MLDEQGNAIPGLLAAGGDSGGVYVGGGYAGGLANALTFGPRAARTALAGQHRRSQASRAYA